MKTRIASLLALALVAGPRIASAHDGAGGNLGVGLGVGAPTGLSIEIASQPLSTFEIAIGVDAFHGTDGYAHLVFKQGFVELANGATVAVPVYLGVGPFMADRRDDRFGSNFDVGVRVPLGLDFDFKRAPLQLFAEIALDVPLFAVNAGADTSASVGGYGGVRLWF
jgi:hypothetical protein